MDIYCIKALSDNYIFCGAPHYEKSNLKKKCFLVDPGEAEPVIDFLGAHDLSVEAILLTHHHNDHIGGVLEIRNHFGGEIYGFKKDQNRLPKPINTVLNNEEITICGYPCRVHFTPGHTSGHIIYHFYTENICFVGDVLFSMGCGRIFEGTFLDMYNSLLTIKSLDLDTKIYCAHEYTVNNIRFVESLIADHKKTIKHDEAWRLEALGSYENQVNSYMAMAIEKREHDLPTVPFQLKDEISLNPFIAITDYTFRDRLGFGSFDGLEAFSNIRSQKDQF